MNTNDIRATVDAFPLRNMAPEAKVRQFQRKLSKLGATRVISLLARAVRPSLTKTCVCTYKTPTATHSSSFTMAPSTTATSSSKEAADAALKAPMPTIDWLQCLELGYDGTDSNESSVCFSCGAESAQLSKCARCQTAGYCCKTCQVSDWKSGAGGGHKYSCQG